MASLRKTTASPGASVSVRHLSMSYGTVPVVKDVSLDILPGEFVTLLGASGSGKTTILRIIAGFLKETSGGVFVDDQEVSSVPVHRRDMGMVFQSYALFPHMSVSKNVGFPLEMRGIGGTQRTELVASALQAVRLSDFGARRPTPLSGGQQQRVAFARAIVASPRVLLMDEPLGALDRRLRESLQLEMLRLSRERGLTVINVTHDQEEAMSMSDRIALLVDGRVEQFGTPQELYRTPATTAVAEFLGESNVFRGDLMDRPAGGRFLRTVSGDLPVGPSTTTSQSAAALVVRPHDVRLTAEAPSQDRPSVPGQVAEVIYSGDSLRVLVDTQAGGVLTARRAPELPLKPGDCVFASWDPDAAHLTAVPVG